MFNLFLIIHILISGMQLFNLGKDGKVLFHLIKRAIELSVINT